VALSRGIRLEIKFEMMLSSKLEWIFSPEVHLSATLSFAKFRKFVDFANTFLDEIIFVLNFN
jgi:hypothetical protein